MFKKYFLVKEAISFEPNSDSIVLPIRHCLLLLLCSIFCGCASRDESPELYSSASYGLDGSHRIPKIGVPANSIPLKLPSDISATTPPVPLPLSEKETFVIAQGSNIIIGNVKSSRILAHSPDSTAISELLADSTNIYALHESGILECYDRIGKQNWSSMSAMLPMIGSAVVDRQIVVATDSILFAFNSSDGKINWSYPLMMAPVSLCLLHNDNRLLVAISGNNSASTDSILCISSAGKLVSALGMAKTRITSNLTATKKGVAFGYLSSANGGTSLAYATEWSVSSGFKQLWSHPLPYIVSTISTSEAKIIAGGFRENTTEVTSGIEAFESGDSTIIWRRRFAYPIVNPVAVSDAYAYIPFTFTTQAAIETKTILMTIDLADGKTYSELPITGSTSGFVQGIGMPIEGMLVYADRSAAQLYFLKP